MKGRRPAVSLTRAERDVQKLDDARRQVLADWCRLVGHRVKPGGKPMAAAIASTQEPPSSSVTTAKDPSAASASLEQAVAGLGLPPRAQQVLFKLLAGASEKQIAQDLSISRHTVHTYVKQLHKRLNVASRGELLSRFLDARRAG